MPGPASRCWLSWVRSSSSCTVWRRGMAGVGGVVLFSGAMSGQARPGPLLRVLGRAVTSAVARFPATWQFLRVPVRRFFDAQATNWDERAGSDPTEYLAPLSTALDHLPITPGRILDIGTGTGAAAIEMAARFADAEIVGIDVSAEMIARARSYTSESPGRPTFLVADAADFEHDEGFDLITMLNMPPFFDRVVVLLAPGGCVVHASSHGARTPFFSPPGVLRSGFSRRGLQTVASGCAGPGTFYIGRRP